MEVFEMLHCIRPAEEFIKKVTSGGMRGNHVFARAGGASQVGFMFGMLHEFVDNSRWQTTSSNFSIQRRTKNPTETVLLLAFNSIIESTFWYFISFSVIHEFVQRGGTFVALRAWSRLSAAPSERNLIFPLTPHLRISPGFSEVQHATHVLSRNT
jgi:hypothetical protein